MAISPRRISALALLCCLAACGEPRAVLLPLQYPDGQAVRSRTGEPVMAGYQTYGSAMHANATALYASAAPADCVSCARLGAVVSEPSVLRQATGVLGVSTVGAGSVMGGLGMMNYGNAALDGKLGSNVSNTSNVSTDVSASASTSTNVAQRGHVYWDHGHDGAWGGGNNMGNGW